MLCGGAHTRCATTARTRHGTTVLAIRRDRFDRFAVLRRCVGRVRGCSPEARGLVTDGGGRDSDARRDVQWLERSAEARGRQPGKRSAVAMTATTTTILGCTRLRTCAVISQQCNELLSGPVVQQRTAAQRSRERCCCRWWKCVMRVSVAPCCTHRFQSGGTRGARRWPVGVGVGVDARLSLWKTSGGGGAAASGGDTRTLRVSREAQRYRDRD